MSTNNVFRVSYRYYKFDENLNIAELGNFILDALSLKQISRFAERSYSEADIARVPFLGLEKILHGCEVVTVCIVEDAHKLEVARGYAFFVPDDTLDESRKEQRQFNRREGRRISFKKVRTTMAKNLSVDVANSKFFTYYKDLKDYLAKANSNENVKQIQPSAK